MSNNLLVLPNEHTKEDQMIWRAAIRRGWKTLRFDPNKPEKIEGYDMVRYYGNVLNKKRIEKYLPIRFAAISPTILSELDISWTGRTIKSMKYSELENPLSENRFIKCVDEKWIPAAVYPKGLDHRVEWKGMQPDDLIYVQTPIEFINEMRCFVVDREVVTASWYRKDKVFCPEFVMLGDTRMDAMVPRAYTYNLTRVMREFHSPLPNGVVLDWGQDDWGNWTLIEANEVWASGLYDNDPEKVLDTIIASQDNEPKTLP